MDANQYIRRYLKVGIGSTRNARESHALAMSIISRLFSRLHLTEHRLFLAGIILKGIDGLLEVISGGTILFVGVRRIRYLLWLWTSGELSQEPGNVVAQKVAHVGQHLSSQSARFVGIYLLAHGAVKLGLVVGMLRGWRWAYPTAEVILVAFIGYQCYRLTTTWSWILLIVTFIDAAIVVLIHLEYRRVRQSLRASR
jgi:uncharacterized membrane protein